MPQISQISRMRAVSLPQHCFFVFESQTGDIKLKKVSRTEVDALATSGNQMDIINTATTILTKSEYGNRSIRALYLNGDQTTGIVRLVIEVTRDDQGKVKLYMGRVDQGNWIQCANTPIAIDDEIRDIQFASGNTNEINVIATIRGLYLEGH